MMLCASSSVSVPAPLLGGSPVSHNRGMAKKRSDIEYLYGVIGANIAYQRSRKRWSQAELTERLGWSKGYLPQVELGKTRIMLHDIERLGIEFGINPRKLLQGLWK